MVSVRDIVNSIFDPRSSGFIIMSYIETPIEENKWRYSVVVSHIKRLVLSRLRDEDVNGPHEKNWLNYNRMMRYCFHLKRPSLTDYDEELINKCAVIETERSENRPGGDVCHEVHRIKVEIHDMRKLLYMKTKLKYSDFVLWFRQFKSFLSENSVSGGYYDRDGENYHRFVHKYYGIDVIITHLIPERITPPCCTIM